MVCYGIFWSGQLKYDLLRFCVLPSYVNYLEQHFVLSRLLYLGVKTQQYFVSASCMPSLVACVAWRFWLGALSNKGYIFGGTGPGTAQMPRRNELEI